MLKYNLEIFDSFNEKSAYLLGAFVTDGCVTTGARNKIYAKIAAKDADWIEVIRDTICPGKYIENKINISAFQTLNSKVVDWLLANNCSMKKSLTLKMPNIPKNMFYHFLRGCFDGDGSICFFKYEKIKNNKTYYYQQGNCYLCSASKNFIEDIAKQLTELGHKFSLIKIIPKKGIKINGKEIKSQNPIYRVSFSGTNCYKIVKCMYQDCTISMPRKQMIANNILDYYNNKTNYTAKRL